MLQKSILKNHRLWFNYFNIPPIGVFNYINEVFTTFTNINLSKVACIQSNNFSCSIRKFNFHQFLIFVNLNRRFTILCYRQCLQRGGIPTSAGSSGR